MPLTGLVLREGIDAISTPLRWEVWAKEVEGHSDKAYAVFVVGRIRNGFRIGRPPGICIHGKRTEITEFRFRNGIKYFTRY